MEIIRIEILNPKARKLLKNLAELKLIKIKKDKTSGRGFKQILEKLRDEVENVPNEYEIIKEVETVREKKAKAR